MAPPVSKPLRVEAKARLEAGARAADDSGRRRERRDLSGLVPVPEGDNPIPASPGGSGPSGGTFETDMGNELQNVLERFQGDIRKILYAKRKRLVMETNASIESLYQKIDEVWIAQKEQRKKLYHDYSQRFLTLYQECNVNVQKVKKEEEILTNILQLQQQLCPYYTIVHRKRMQALKKLSDQFLKRMEDLEESQERVVTGEQSELRKKMARIQKHFLMKHLLKFLS